MIKEDNTGNKTLVIGGAGYIGSVLVRKLLGQSEEVTVLDKLIYGNGSSVSGLMDNPSFSFIHGDFADDATLERALQGVKNVVLLAALVGDPICKKYPELAQKTNLDAPVKLLEVLKGRGIDRFVFTSTCSNYGLIEGDELADEEFALNPQSLYARTKVEYEKHILSRVDELDLSPTILRLSTAFGDSERMRFDLSISDFTRQLAIGQELLVYDEKTWRPYCHTRDISDTIIRVINAPAEMVSGQVFNVGTGTNNYTKQMIVDLVRKHIPEAKISYHSGDSDPRNYRVDFKKLRETLRWEPVISADEAVKNLIAAIHNHLYDDYEQRKNFYGNYEIIQ